ncbi:MAG: serine/threonine protein kinase [Candidatus Nephthysia bennettiae]|uniref:Serine/threonine-protein kinase PknG n=1 Tax=Candidatus Nephthysia bennettiae TaxID=3127016 RepID=A0A934K0D0_9BACT|nr:protein kinase [Candidatus Dormibacteraeota bacterium]MBJ7615058.1 protein kinase [Candidatus Dormibacteraeota bacterium]PZS00048.1 MAG: serine/threonine protein kinase [Candidatus Dormibacteraeota bacterium]
MNGESCQATPGCPGTVEDGYCDVCGKIAVAAVARATAGGARTATTGGFGTASPPTDGDVLAEGLRRRSIALPDRPALQGEEWGSGLEGISHGSASSPSGGSARATSSRRTGTASTRTATRTRIGAGLVSVPPMPTLDPAAAMMVHPEVAEARRFCSNCGAEVGRGRDGRPGRVAGFCSKCRHQYSFAPTLLRGDLVASQYRIAGCLAYGGLGWIYLAQDEQVSNRWVVLKGLLNVSDPDAMTSAVAERQFLASVEHPNVVRIYNFVQHGGAGYIVMEYVGGKTLKNILVERRQAAGAGAGPLPVEHAIAYVLGILPAFSYLHRLGLVYNDFKPDNVMVYGDDVKLIDLGAVTHVDSPNVALFGTDGFQAPEVPSLGPSAVSDLYTIARSLAMLILDFRGYQTGYRYSLPSPIEQPLLGEQESLHRFLLKGTAENPDDRFQTADEMGEQLLGVLREVVARRERAPRPAASSLFGADLQAIHAQSGAAPIEPDWRYLPPLKVNPGDPAASFVVNVAALTDPTQQLRLLGEATSQGQVPDTAEVELGVARALIWMGRLDEAVRRLDLVAQQDPWDWRVIWYRGVALLSDGSHAEARSAFQRVSTDLPGELGPKLGEALAAELGGDLERAARLYDVVSTTDPSFTSACFGLARVRDALGDRAGAVEAYRRIPETSSLYTQAQLALARTLVRERPESRPGVTELVQASATVKRLRLDPHQRSQVSVELLETALILLGSRAVLPDSAIDVLGHPLEWNRLRHGLEQAYRDLARFAIGEEKIRLVDRANQVRPMTAV